MASEDEQPQSYTMRCKVDLEGNWKEVPDRFCKLLEYSREEIKQCTITDIFESSTKDKGPDLLKKIKEGTLRELATEKLCTTKSGQSVWLSINSVMIRDNKGDPQYVVCYVHDITDKKESHKKQEQSEQRFRSLFKHNPHPVYYFDLEGRFRGVNEKLVEFAGFSREQLLGMSYESFIVEEDLKRTHEQFKKAASGIPIEYEISVIVKEVEKKDIRVTNFPMYVGDEVKGVFGILQDITEQKRARQRLKESEERWERLIRNNPQPVQIVQDGKIIFLNQSGAELYGAKSPNELIGRPITEFSHPDTVRKIEKREQRLIKGEDVEPSEHKIVTLDGTEKYIEAQSVPIKYNGDIAIQTVIHDLTEREKEEKLVRSSLKEKEILLKEIHHRIKNNLAVISGLLELQTMNIEDDAVLNALKNSQLRIQSIAMIHEKLYQSEALSHIGFDAYLAELVDAISDTYSSTEQDIKISFDVEPVAIDLDKAIPCSLIVNEVLINCYKHAFKKKDTGNIKINSVFDEPDLTIQIKDNGCGLPENFAIGEQQSLGMTLVQTLAKQLDGKINFSSNDGNQGTTFKLCFEI